MSMMGLLRLRKSLSVKKLKKSLSMCFLIAYIAFISGCVEADTVPLVENVSSIKFPESVTYPDYFALHMKEIEDIDNGTYFEITDDELKEHPEINKSIRGGEGCTKFYSGGWYCKLNSDEWGKYIDFCSRKHSKYLFSIDLKFRNKLNNNTIDAELINTFNSNGFQLSEKYSILAIPRSFHDPPTPYNWWYVNEKVDTAEYTIYEIKGELKVYKAGFIEYQFVKIGEHYYEMEPSTT